MRPHQQRYLGFVCIALICQVEHVPLHALRAVQAEARPVTKRVDTALVSELRDGASLRSAVDASLDRAAHNIKQLRDYRGKRTVDNTLLPYDLAWAELRGALGLTSLVNALHPDATMRDVAAELEARVRSELTALELDPMTYAAIQGIDARSADQVTRHYLTVLLRDFRLAGADRPEPVRTEVRRLISRREALEREFAQNRRNRREVTFTPRELSGLPKDFLDAHRPDASGRITLSTDMVNVLPLLQYAQRSETRKRMFLASRSSSAPENINVLEELIEVRTNIARLLGFEDWASYEAAPRVVNDVKGVHDFLDRVTSAVDEGARQEYAALLRLKQKDEPGASIVEAWDREYYVDQLANALYSFDSQAVRAYFPSERVKTGVFNIMERLFGVTFQRIDDAQVWHADVESFNVLQSTKVIARMYLDLHPRQDKVGRGAGVLKVRPGGFGRAVPELVLYASLPKSRADDPALLTHDQVRTLFHEFGHVIHEVVSGQGRWQKLTGIQTEFDFIEVPSTLLEEWMWDPKTLHIFAKHYETNTDIPEPLLLQMRRSSRIGDALDLRWQASLAAASVRLHEINADRVDSTAIVRAAFKKYSLIPLPEGAYPHAQFPQLAQPEYSSGYFVYLWSRVVAADLLTKFNRQSLLDPAPAARFRDIVLAPGGSVPGHRILTEFLGRAVSFDAFATRMKSEQIGVR